MDLFVDVSLDNARTVAINHGAASERFFDFFRKKLNSLEAIYRIFVWLKTLLSLCRSGETCIFL